MRRLFPVVALLSAAAGLVVTALWLRDGGDAALTLSLRTAGLAGITAFLTAINLMIRWLRWHYLVRRTILSTPTRRSLKLYFGTLPALATPLYVGESLRTALAARGTPALGRTVFTVWFTERLADAGILALFWTAAAGEWAAFMLIVAALFATALLANRMFGSPSATAEAVVVLASTSLAAWALPVLAPQLVLGGLGASLSLADSAEAFSAGTLLGGLSLLPAGFGVTGSSMIYRLTATGIDEAIAIAAIALFRAGTTGFALALGALVFAVWRSEITSLAPRAPAQEHFDELADEYEEQIPTHIRDRLLVRKVAVMVDWLSRRGVEAGARGLDVGCGQGWYAAEMAQAGFRMFACDRSVPQLAHARPSARQAGVTLGVGSADQLPYADNSFDFVYGANVIHHITDPEQRRRAFDEIVRVLAPGGCFFLQEINVRNPLFALYMGYVFPLLREIDDGTEVWLRPLNLPEVAGARWDEHKEYLTFLPDFVPPAVYAALRPLESRLEQSSARVYSAHFVACLVKTPTSEPIR